MKKGFIGIAIAIVSTFLLLGAFVFIVSLDYQNPQTYECSIKDKYLKRDGDKDEFRVVCGEETYKISDLLFIGKFNSADIYSKIEIGKKYKIETTGYRIQFFSSYQNINNAKRIE